MNITRCLKDAYTVLFPTGDTGPGKFTRQKGFWTPDTPTDGFFTKLMDPKSQRENWYTVSNHIAEFWCAMSNIGFFYVANKHRSPELLFAGLASLAAHSAPKQWLLTVDKIGVLLVLTKCIREYSVVQKNPWLIGPVALAGLINAADAYLARTRGYTWPHVVWHLSSAALADLFLNASFE